MPSRPVDRCHVVTGYQRLRYIDPGNPADCNGAPALVAVNFDALDGRRAMKASRSLAAFCPLAAFVPAGAITGTHICFDCSNPKQSRCTRVWHET